MLRWIGAEGWASAQARQVLDALDIPASPTTVSIQLGEGRKGEKPAAELSKKQQQELAKLAG